MVYRFKPIDSINEVYKEIQNFIGFSNSDATQVSIDLIITANFSIRRLEQSR